MTDEDEDDSDEDEEEGGRRGRIYIPIMGVWSLLAYAMHLPNAVCLCHLW